MTILPQPADNGSNRALQQHVTSVLRTLLDYPLPSVSWEIRDNQPLRVKFGQSQLSGYVVREGRSRSDEELANSLAQWAEFLNAPIVRTETLYAVQEVTWEVAATFNDVIVRIWASIGVEHDARCFPAEAAAEAAIRKAEREAVETPREPEPDSDSGSGAGERLEQAVEHVRPQISGPGTMLAEDAPAIYAEMLKATEDTGGLPSDAQIDAMAQAAEDRIASAAGR